MPISTISTGGIADSINIDNGTLVVDGVNNRVGIGTASPATALTIASEGKLRLYRADNARYGDIYNDNSFLNIETSNDPIKISGQTYIRFDTDGSEAMRIDSSGNLLVGKTASNVATEGAEIRSSGFTGLTVDGGAGLTIRRLTSDGELQSFFKDTNKVGTIGVSGSDNLYIAGGTGSTKGIIFNDIGALPATTGGAASDASIDIGQNNFRWKDLYLSGGVYLGGTGSANKMDDYEEGTWTAVISEVSRTTSVTYQGFSSASYTKVGNTVFATIELGISSHDGTTSSTAWKFTGFPFSPNTARGGFSIYNNNSGALIGGGRFDSGSYNAIGYFALPSASTLYTTFVYQTNS